MSADQVGEEAGEEEQILMKLGTIFYVHFQSLLVNLEEENESREALRWQTDLEYLKI